ncbi:hypothetical protein, partial [Enterobacter hormaechei]|uniref:hypothetical protein n=1 Tax=Enterobacter hormaechei TaxID=158836 RepID=UPI002574DA7F
WASMLAGNQREGVEERERAWRGSWAWEKRERVLLLLVFFFLFFFFLFFVLSLRSERREEKRGFID